MILVPGDTGQVRLGDLIGAPDKIVDTATPDGRYLVIAADDGLYRAILPGEGEADGLSYIVPSDANVPLRIAALQRFHALVTGSSMSREPRRDVPSRHQRARLETMLRILDGLDCPAGQEPSLRKLAGTAVYPGATFPRSIEWKSRSERRQTSRLLRDAVMLRDGAYRQLLTAYNTQA